MSKAKKEVTPKHLADFAEISTSQVIYWAKIKGYKKTDGKWLWTWDEGDRFGRWLRLSTMGDKRRNSAKKAQVTDSIAPNP